MTPYRETTLIDVLAYNQDPEEAAEIANATAEAYRKYRLNSVLDEMTASIDVLRDEISSQNEKVSQSESKLQEIREEVGFTLVKGLDSDSFQVQELELSLIHI